MSFRSAVALLTLLIAVGYQQVKPQTGGDGYNGLDLVDKTGDIRKPGDFRDHYQALGTYTVLDPKGDQMHLTYASPGAAEYYRKNGKFADGTVLVKEVFGTDHAQMTTGESDAPDKQVATDYKKDCLGCHIPARGTDWVYVQGYPVLASK
jgi:hypothetical protein